MMRLLSELVKLPMSAFVRTMEVFAVTFKELQAISDQGIDSIVALAAVERWNAAPSSARAATFTSSTNLQEVRRMVDQDLSGDDLKYVSYTILFTKRDLEATLAEEQQDVVSYSTDGGSYGALKIAKFMRKIGRGEVRRPPTWKANRYPDDAVDETHWEIPDDDLKYISFIYRVDRHLPRQEAEYDKEQVKVLREIRDRL